MKRICLPPLTNAVTILLLSILVLGALPVGVLSKQILESSGNCVDVALIFARGSGQNQYGSLIHDPLDQDFAEVEKESYRFFLETKNHLDNRYPLLDYKAVTIHDFPGKYHPVGYRAVPVGYDDPQRLLNSSNADASWVPGHYRESVEGGIAETVGYIKDQIQTCPSQHLIVGGYSQGAQVMGESLFQLTVAEQDKILGVGLFGDPKYIGFHNGESKPWRRGEATNKDTGMLDPRIPYVPQNLEQRTISWCSRNDIVCAGWSATRTSSSHSGYSLNPILFASDELMQMASPVLNAKQRAKGGFSSSPGTTELTQENRNKIRDVMFLINDNSNLSTLQTFRYGLDPMLHHFSTNFAGTRYAAKAIGEHDYGFSAPRVTNIQSFLPYMGFNPSQPMTTASNMTYSFLARYPFGQPIMGGGDIQDPYQLGLERSIVSSGWRADSTVERNIIMIIDRSPKDPYEYNICNGTIRQWLQFPDIDGYKNCYTNFNRETWQKVLHPETCETVVMVITQDTCTNPLKAASTSQLNKRSLSDTAKLAQAYNTKISIVLPHAFTDSYNHLSQQSVRDQLRQFAHQTGGTFLYYDKLTQYSSTALNDTLFQVFTKSNRSLSLVSNGTTAQPSTQAKTNEPTVLDVSRAFVDSSTYKWDFNDDGTWDQQTSGPVTQHSFVSTGPTFVRIQAVDGAGQSLAETRRLFTVLEGEGTEEPVAPVVSNMTARQMLNNEISLNWQPAENNRLLVIDPTSRQLITALDGNTGNAIISVSESYQGLEFRLMSSDAVSAPTLVDIEPYVPLPILIPLPIITSPNTTVVQEPSPEARVFDDETLCYKLQQCIEPTRANLTADTQSVVITRPQAQATSSVLSPPQSIAPQPISQPQVAAATDSRFATPPSLPEQSTSNKSSFIALIIVMLLAATYITRRKLSRTH